MAKFEIGKNTFLLNGEPFRILAGAIHYFRVPQQYWRDRLLKLKACGFNTVETYVAWNAHEMQEGQPDFSGMLDIAAFLKTAQDVGLYAIVRPGPYICAEWEFGGLPWWLLKKEGIELRCMNKPYLDAVARFYELLMAQVMPMQVTHGGNVLMMQVENEYGSFGNDHEYIAWMENTMRALGVDVPLFTSDGPTDYMLTGGTLPHIFKTANFGSNAQAGFKKLREYETEGPLMCTEYWNGWFDHWLEEHHTRDAADAAKCLDEILQEGASVSAYMFHGGTNFGLMNGANGLKEKAYEPTVNSYDYDSPLNECGDPTEKYFLMREVLKKYTTVPEPEVSLMPSPKADYGVVRFTESADLLDNLSAISSRYERTMPVPMEQLNQGYGLILYRTHIAGPRENAPLRLADVHDRAHIFLNGTLQGIEYRNDTDPAVSFSVTGEGAVLDVLVENMGRINYGPNLADSKGITRRIVHGIATLSHYEIFTMPLTDLSSLSFRPGVPAFTGRPLFMRGSLTISGTPLDTFIHLPSFQKGFVFINGRLLSRYWSAGPQHSCYVPAPYLHTGANEITVLELDGCNSAEVEFKSEMNLG